MTIKKKIVKKNKKKMVEVEVNNKKIVVEEGWPLIEVCRMAGIEIPRFCYHESLGIAGNCRMCLVEVERSLKPVASCAMPVADGMKIHTDSLLVKKAREGVMEFLLANHPLDCPICDQGGECDLQDQAMVFGNDRGRYYENKRAVENKDFGPLVKTVMTRCIHCTRCVRFMAEVAGTNELGTMGRGNEVEIGGYIEKKLTSEISGNVIDLCPVGALTAKPHAFQARPWELRSIESVDVFDSLGANIYLEIRGNDLMRITPLVNDEVNQNWITDKTRFALDGVNKQRLVNPMIKQNGNLVPVSWEESFKRIAMLLQGDVHLDVVVGNMVDLESLVMVRELVNSLGYGKINGQTNIQGKEKDVVCTNNYIFNTPLSRIEESDVCLIVGTNLRVELPLVAVRLRRSVNELGMKVYTVGGVGDYYFKTESLGTRKKTWYDILEGRHKFCVEYARAERPLLFLGEDLVTNKVFSHLGKYTNLKSENWDGRNAVHLGASNVGLYELGLVNYIEKSEKKENQKRVLYALDCDEIVLSRGEYDYIIYQGHHGDNLAEEADVILAGSVFLEKEGYYANVEGRWQKTESAITPRSTVRTDWSIIRGLVEYLVEYPENLYNSIREVRSRLYELCPRDNNKVGYGTLNFENSSEYVCLNDGIFSNKIDNFYMTDSVSRASKVMSLCTKTLRKENE